MGNRRAEATTKYQPQISAEIRRLKHLGRELPRLHANLDQDFSATYEADAQKRILPQPEAILEGGEQHFCRLGFADDGLIEELDHRGHDLKLFRQLRQQSG